MLEHIISLATKPQLAVVKSSGVVLTGQEEEDRLETPSGLDFSQIERLQIHWMNNPKICKVIREYQKALTSATGEYVLQFMLDKLVYAKESHIFPDWEKERAVISRIEESFDIPSYIVLDSAYYNAGNRFYRFAGELFEQLYADNFGKLFVLNQDELNEIFLQQTKADYRED